MNEIKTPVTINDLKGKMITIPLIRYYELLNDNTTLIRILNSISIESDNQTNREEAYKRWQEQNGGK